MITLILLLGIRTLTVPERSVQVDLIEYNTFYRYEDQQFVQVIFWDWSREYSRFNVRSWRMAQGVRVIEDANGFRWRDPKTGIVVRSKSSIETWTDYDPERLNRRLLPITERVDIFAEKPEYR